jgi:hypothetical protein
MTNNKWFDKLTTLSQVEGQYPISLGSPKTVPGRRIEIYILNCRKKCQEGLTRNFNWYNDFFLAHGATCCGIQWMVSTPF